MTITTLTNGVIGLVLLFLMGLELPEGEFEPVAKVLAAVRVDFEPADVGLTLVFEPASVGFT